MHEIIHALVIALSTYAIIPMISKGLFDYDEERRNNNDHHGTPG